MLGDVYIRRKICRHDADDIRSTRRCQRIAIYRNEAGAGDKDSYKLNIDNHRIKSMEEVIRLRLERNVQGESGEQR